jgi:glycosyltransferase involved in cell wall biosynthesis
MSQQVPSSINRITHPDTLITLATVVQNDADIVTSALEEILVILQKEYHYYELLVIDNGSSDGTHALIQDLQKRFSHIRLLVLSRSYSLEIAFAAALENSIGDYVVLLDINYDPPIMVPKLVAKALEGNDVVIAERQDRSQNAWYQRPLITGFYRLTSRILGYPFSPNASYFRVFSRRTVNSITQIRNKHRYLKYFSAMVGFKHASLAYTRINRSPHRPTHEPFWHMLYLASDIILSHSSAPLRLAALMGLLASLANVVFLIYVFLVVIFKRHVAEGWISTSVMNATMFFLVFLILAVMSEYIARILNESKDQPLYFLAEEFTSSIQPDHASTVNVVS